MGAIASENPKHRGAISAAVAAALLSAPAWAQQSTVQQADTAGPQEGILQEITVTATRRSEALSKVTESISA